MPNVPKPSITPTNPFADHSRAWHDFHYVYPVISRRSHGLSIGINLNPDKACNFDCVYCQVDRSTSGPRRDVDLTQLHDELNQMLHLAVSGALWSVPKFASVNPALRRINDIAFSGDGEPTTFADFDQACAVAVDLKRQYGLQPVKIVIITNATVLHRPKVQQALALLDENQGEVWAKLDAGTDEYYHLVDRTNTPFIRVLQNIRDCGRIRPLVIQSLFMTLHGEPPTPAEFDAYCDRLTEFLAEGCQLKLIQLYTVARRPAEQYVGPLTDAQLDAMAAHLHQRLPQLPIDLAYGAG